MNAQMKADRVKCRLCQEKKELRRSHILPAFFRDDSGSMYLTGNKGVPQPFTQSIHTEAGRRFDRKQHGYWEQRHGIIERLLCHECEQQIGGFEDYAKRFFYGGSDPIRLQLPISKDPLFTADYRKLKLFQLSLLWRASEAKGEFFAAVVLSSEHRERLREMLMREDPGAAEEYFCAMNRLVASPAVERIQNLHGISNETGMFAPVADNHDGWGTFTFVMGGIVWVFCVSECGVPEILRNTYIKENGQFWLMQMPSDNFLINFSQKAVVAGNVTSVDVEESIRTRVRKCGVENAR
jgi:hypothetical protein